MAPLKNRALREKLHEASVARGSRGSEFDNRAIVAKIAKLRAERAKLLGYPNHAAYVLEDETAKTTEAVNKMLADLAPAAVANAKREAADMQAMIDSSEEAAASSSRRGTGPTTPRRCASRTLQLRRVAAQALLRDEQRAARTACSTPPTSSTA